MAGLIASLKEFFPEDENEEPIIKRDPNGKKIIPKVAYYVFGAATFVSVGLSVMMIPILKEAMKQNQLAARAARPTQTFIAHRHTGRKFASGRDAQTSSLTSSTGQPDVGRSLAQTLAAQRLGPPGVALSGTMPEAGPSSVTLDGVTPRKGTAARLEALTEGSQGSNMDIIASDIEPHRSLSPPLSPSASASSSTAPLSGKGKEPALSDHPEWPEDPSLQPSTPELDKSRWFNTLEERRLFGSSPADPETIDGKNVKNTSGYKVGRNDAFKALGIATCIVAGCAGASVWVVSKLLGVSTIEEFGGYMRGTMKTIAPGLVERNEQDARDNPDQWLGWKQAVQEDAEAQAVREQERI